MPYGGGKNSRRVIEVFKNVLPPQITLRNNVPKVPIFYDNEQADSRGKAERLVGG